MSEQNELRIEVIAFICSEIKRLVPEGTTVNDNTDITTDLSLDSVAIMDLVFAIEEKFDISISLNALSEIYKVGQLADLTCSIKNQ